MLATTKSVWCRSFLYHVLLSISNVRNDRMEDTPEVIISNAARFVISYGSVEITSVFNNTFNAWWLKLTLAHILGLRYTEKSYYLSP